MFSGIGRINNQSQEFGLLAHLERLQHRQEQIDRQITTGRRDTSSSYFTIANKLGVDVRGIGVALDNIADGLDLIRSAMAALETIDEKLSKSRDLALRAANETLNDEQRQKIGLEIRELLDAAGDIAQRSRFNGIRLLEGQTIDLFIGSKGDAPDKYSVRLPEIGTDVLAEPSQRPGCPRAPEPPAPPLPRPGCPHGTEPPATPPQTSPPRPWGALPVPPAPPCSSSRPKDPPPTSDSHAHAHSPRNCPQGPDNHPNPPLLPDRNFNAEQTLGAIDRAIERVKDFISRLRGDSEFLNNYRGVLQERLTRTESMRSRFEDADVTKLSLESSRNDLYRQAALTTLARAQANQQAIIAAFLGGGR